MPLRHRDSEWGVIFPSTMVVLWPASAPSHYHMQITTGHAVVFSDQPIHEEQIDLILSHHNIAYEELFWYADSVLELEESPFSKRWPAQIIYFLQSGTNGPIKIGTAVFPLKRISALQTANPEDLRLIGILPGCGQLETNLHELFRADHKRGEWFNPSPALLAYIQESVVLNPKARLDLEQGD